MLRTVTTSWDDGHPLDFRLAELLDRYKLPATFYIPKNNPEREVMKEEDILQLSKQFEIGGHTLNHLPLIKANEPVFEYEIKGSFIWLKDLLGHEPVSFCFPLGKHNSFAINSVFKSGYKVARTTELLSTKCLTAEGLLPTTLQAYEHSPHTYFKHLLKRKKIIRIMSLIRTYSNRNLLELSKYFVKEVIKKGGCFHLWGHSWELERYGLWKKLEEVMKIISNRPDITYVSNKDILLPQFELSNTQIVI